MTVPIVLLPTSQGVGVYALGLGLKYALEQQGYSVKRFNPLAETTLKPAQIEQYFLSDQVQDLLTEFLSFYDRVILNTKADFVLIEGAFISENNQRKWFNPYVDVYNSALIRAFNAYVMLIARGDNRTQEQLDEHLSLVFKGVDRKRLLGVVVTKLNAPVDENGQSCFSLLDEFAEAAQHHDTPEDIAKLPIFQQKKPKMPLLGVTLWQEKLAYPRVVDVQRFLNCDILMPGEMDIRRVKMMTICSRSVDYIIKDLKPGVLIITSADRTDVILAACLAAQRGIKIAGLLLTASYYLSEQNIAFFKATAEEAKLPILTTTHKTIQTVLSLVQIDYSAFPDDDTERLQFLQESISEALDVAPLIAKLHASVEKKMSPPAFRHYLLRRAQQVKPRIVLPEGDEPRTLKAAIYCQENGIADCLLIGDRETIEHTATLHGFVLPEEIAIVEPKNHRERYVKAMLELRKHRGLNEVGARSMLEDNVVLGTMMVQAGDADALVSGAVHTTASTISPALKFIKTKPDCALVSSVFFMCMEDQVLVYGDCAINPDPDAQALADIAIQSAQTAIAFGIEPKVAMLSYSTGESGKGAGVDKVKQATAIVKTKMPELLIDGPMQYDAATVESVGQQKAPNSPVAGQANVLIFPDLASGNATYKAVQRSAHVLSIGPVLQGLAKPVNDLSRGATVDDIIYTIAVSAIQVG